jgi:hypothetical protein
MSSPTLDTVPQEVLEQIALFCVTDCFLGPPSALSPLIITNHKVYSRLSIASNPHIYARIFAYKFDIASAIRRLGPGRTTPLHLAHELKLRCLFLKRIRSRLDSIAHAGTPESDVFSSHDLICHAYLLMLENEGKNEKQLREYAGLDDWLREYWFAESGASRAVSSINAGLWPLECSESSIAMWLFWFLLKPGNDPSFRSHPMVLTFRCPDDYGRDDGDAWTALQVLKTFALAAHKVRLFLRHRIPLTSCPYQYNVTSTPWTIFYSDYRPANPTSVVHYSELYQITPPPLTIPAILSYLTLVNGMGDGVGFANATPLPPSHFLSYSSSEWDCEWARCFGLHKTEYDKVVFTPRR